ncbi:MAG: hypothetical protein J6Y89_05955, partial [Lachnospiraceae bacterium]|nr:hypothetical protein [Lachnospiraceae bacterium]
MYKRNRFEAGRFVAALLAVVLISLIPLRILIARNEDEAGKKIALYLDGFISTAKEKKYINTEDYEKLKSEMSALGIRYEVELSLEREAAVISQNAVFPVAAHVHGPSCYAGHNHTASGCRFHVHSQSCYCTGTYTSYLRSESGTFTCPTCMGRGTTGYIDTCPTCNGEEPGLSEVPCSYCDQTGTSYEDVWVVCPDCNGAGCNRCDEGKDGGWYKKDYVTCPVCNGSLTMLKRVPCSTCGGKGTVGEIVTCSNCNGNKTISSDVSFYKCDKCGQGDSSSYGMLCGRRICGMDFESYECGITNEDLFPRCDRIIVDIRYDNSCTIRQFDTEDMVNTSVRFTYLDGTMRDFRTKLVSGSDTFNSRQAGVLNLRLAYTGYYERADNYETRYFPITVTVAASVAQCAKCGKTYYLNEDGSDPGCPYCVDTSFSITVIVKGDVRIGTDPDIDVYAVSGNETRLLDESEYDLFCDTDSVGLQQAAVYYRGIWEYFTINVIPDPNTPGAVGTGIPTGA